MICDCDVSLGNTGRPGCKALMNVIKKLILVPYFNQAGTVNSITIAGLVFDQAFLDGKVQEDDPFLRWFPTVELDNIENTRADSILETLTSGANIKIQDGTRTFLGFAVEETPNYADKIRNNGCTELGFFGIDKDGNLIGNGGTDGELRPIKIDRRTWDSGFMFPGDTETSKVRFKFDIAQTERDEDVRIITAGNITADLINASGLIDALADGAATAVSTTGFTQKIKTCYGDITDPVLVKNLVAADFVSSSTGAAGQVYNETDDADVAILSVAEAPDGTYAFTFAAQDVSDVMVLAIDKAKGYDSAELETSKVTIV